MLAIALIIIAHWYLSLTMQTVFHHRYAAHGYYKLTKLQEKIGFFLSLLLQGPSYLNPHAYGILHLAHHKYSDSEQDPHSPVAINNPIKMMWHTAKVYHAVVEGKHKLNKEFKPFIDNWESFEKIAGSWVVRIAIGALYFWYYMIFAPSLWWLVLLPFHWFIGPIQGFIVNWCGHMYGYRNYKTSDASKNTLPIDFLLMGELYQNNHHGQETNPCFARKWWEIDVGYVVLVLATLPNRLFMGSKA